MTTVVETFLEKFLRAPKGNSPEQITGRIRHWIDVCNHPERYCKDAGAYAISAKRRSARQNLRRLARKNPHIVADIMREAEVAQ